MTKSVAILFICCRELMKAYPDAKVVLTVRNPETWQASIKNTLCRMIDLHNDFAVRLFTKMMGTWYLLDTVTKITDKVVQPMGKSEHQICK